MTGAEFTLSHSEKLDLHEAAVAEAALYDLEELRRCDSLEDDDAWLEIGYRAPSELIVEAARTDVDAETQDTTEKLEFQKSLTATRTSFGLENSPKVHPDNLTDAEREAIDQAREKNPRLDYAGAVYKITGKWPKQAA